MTAGSQKRPKMMFWHASVAKNTAHLFAVTSELERIRGVTEARAVAAVSEAVARGWAAEPPGVNPEEEVLRSLALINCDCDNVFHSEFVVEALRALMTSRRTANPSQVEPPLGVGCYAESLLSGLSGRVAYWSSDFLRIGGYDEEDGVVGAGWESHDICGRLAAAAAPQDLGLGIALTKSLGLAVSNKVGATTLEDRGLVKVENCRPSDKLQLKSARDFMIHNSKLMLGKTEAGQLVRNVEHSVGGGAPNLRPPLRLLLEASAASMGAHWAGMQARPSKRNAIVVV